MSKVAVPVETTFDEPEEFSDSVERFLRRHAETEKVMTDFMAEIEQIEEHVRPYASLGNTALFDAVYDPVIDLTAMELPHQEHQPYHRVDDLGRTGLHHLFN